MAGPRTCRSFCRNSLPIGKDELAKAALIKGSGTSILNPIISSTSTLYSAIEMAKTYTCRSPC